MQAIPFFDVTFFGIFFKQITQKSSSPDAEDGDFSLDDDFFCFFCLFGAFAGFARLAGGDASLAASLAAFFASAAAFFASAAVFLPFNAEIFSGDVKIVLDIGFLPLFFLLAEVPLEAVRFRLG